MDEQILPNEPSVEIVEFQQISEYIQLTFQLIPLAHSAIDLAKQLDTEKTNRLQIQENADIQRRLIERRMDQLDAELEADLENNKTIISASMRAFEKMVEAGHIEQAMILHGVKVAKLQRNATR